MTEARRSFLEEQVRALAPFGFLSVAVVTAPPGGLHVLEVSRSEDGSSLRVVAVGRPELPTEIHDRVVRLGFSGDPLTHDSLSDPAEAAELIDRTLTEAFGAAEGSAIEVHQGSHRAQVLLERKLAGLRDRIKTVLIPLMAEGTWEIDDDGDLTFSFDSTRVFVGPRALPDGSAIVLVFSPTNLAVEPSPALGLFLAETNFALAFGRFGLDVEHGVVWFGQNLYGESFTDEELRFLVKIIASTADAFDDRIQELFGGRLFNEEGQEPSTDEVPRSKPGTGGYL